MRRRLQSQAVPVGKSRGLPLEIEDLDGIVELPPQNLGKVPAFEEIADGFCLLPRRGRPGLKHLPEIQVSHRPGSTCSRGGFPDRPIDLDRSQGGGCAAVGVQTGQGPTEDHLPSLLPGRQVHNRAGNANQGRQRLSYFSTSRREAEKQEGTPQAEVCAGRCPSPAFLTGRLVLRRAQAMRGVFSVILER